MLVTTDPLEPVASVSVNLYEEIMSDIRLTFKHLRDISSHGTP